MKKYAENTPLNSELNAKEIKDHKKKQNKSPSNLIIFAWNLVTVQSLLY